MKLSLFLDSKVIKEEDGSWHIGFFLHVANCDGCEEKSYAAAEVETENQEHWQNFLNFIERRKIDVQNLLKEYSGSNKSRDSKFMAGIYRGEIRSYDDLLYWAKFFLEIEPEESVKASPPDA